METLTLSRFLDRLRREPTTRFTWLVGAGLSASAGIPLAAHTSSRIVLFEYILSCLERIPWAPEVSTRELTYSPEALSAYFGWYESASLADNDEFNGLIEKSEAWLRTQPGFESLDPQHSERYQRLFKRFLFNVETAHTFLTALVGRARGINLAHVALAGILRDYPGRSHTVFTTNFDDLLLKALLALGYSARIYGDLNSKDLPITDPSYPQIVHLHGRHTGYRILNTPEQLAQQDPVMRGAFEMHARNSHLLVVGYSGWDDLAMRALQNWKADPSFVKGHVFWVPYKSQDTMLPETLAFLADGCPENRVFLVVNDDNSLGADAFLMAMAAELNAGSGGFTQYREALLKNARAQQDFLLRQIEQHPEFDDPGKAQRMTATAVAALAQMDVHRTTQIRDSVLALTSAEDIPPTVRGSALIDLGRIEVRINELEQAIGHLKRGRELLSIFQSDPAVVAKRNDGLLYLGEAHMRLGDFKEAKGYLAGAKARYRKGDRNGEARVAVLLGTLALWEGHAAHAIEAAEEAHAIYLELADEGSAAVCEKLIADALRTSEREDRNGLAEARYQKAIETFARVGDQTGEANSLTELAELYLQIGRHELAFKALQRAERLYSATENLLGLANVNACFGEILFMAGETESARQRFEISLAVYKSATALHGVKNAQADVIKSLAASKKYAEASDFFNDLKKSLDGGDNCYASAILAKFETSLSKGD